MKSEIKAVVFDFAGVIELNSSGDPMIDIAKVIGVPLDDFRKEYFKHNHLSNVENMRWEDMIIEVADVFDTTEEAKEKISIIKDAFRKENRINTELTEMFSILQRQGFKVAIFSNNTSELRERLNVTGIINLVDDAVISGEIGFQKPHKEAFEILFKKLNLKPNEVVFIDDSPKSLEKADEIGYTPILFKNNEQLKIDLKKLGIQA